MTSSAAVGLRQWGPVQFPWHAQRDVGAHAPRFRGEAAQYHDVERVRHVPCLEPPHDWGKIDVVGEVGLHIPPPFWIGLIGCFYLRFERLGIEFNQ